MHEEGRERCLCCRLPLCLRLGNRIFLTLCATEATFLLSFLLLYVVVVVCRRRCRRVRQQQCFVLFFCASNSNDISSETTSVVFFFVHPRHPLCQVLGKNKVEGIILAGGPHSVYEDGAPHVHPGVGTKISHLVGHVMGSSGEIC